MEYPTPTERCSQARAFLELGESASVEQIEKAYKCLYLAMKEFNKRKRESGESVTASESKCEQLLSKSYSEIEMQDSLSEETKKLAVGTARTIVKMIEDADKGIKEISDDSNDVLYALIRSL